MAKKEINNRIENNDLVLVSTIHEFLWGTVKQFQKQLKIELCKLNEINLKKDIDKGKEDSRYIKNLFERIDLVDTVIYNDSSFNDFENGLIQHDDVIEITKMMYQNYPLLTSIISQKYPYLFVDEYQDTANDTIISLIDYLLNRNKGKFIIGLFGDSHQKIYDYGVGDVEKYYTSNGGLIELVKKEENYRSSVSVVELLNNFRNNIQQIPENNFKGSVQFVYWKNHPEKPKKNITAFNAKNQIEKNKYYEAVVKKLSNDGWCFQGISEDKILVLANSRVAKRAGFGNLYTIFNRRFGQGTKERLLDRNHPLITFFVGTIDKKTSQERRVGLEHLISFWEENNDNDVIRFIRRNGTLLSGDFKHKYKKQISKALTLLKKDRENLLISDILKFVTNNGLLFSKRLNEFIEKIYANADLLSNKEKERLEKDKILFESFIDIQYSELLCFWQHIQNHTVFSTKHGTKGDEFRNVLAVIDDTEWPQEYNFKNFFNNTDENERRFKNTRNLFYVECSRAIENLVVLCLSEIDAAAVNNINFWFGVSNVVDVEEFIK